MIPWAFDSLTRRLPDSPIMVLELGARSHLSLPREAARVIVGNENEAAPGVVRGDIEDSRVLRGALTLLEMWPEDPAMLVSIGGLDHLSIAETFDLIEHVIWDLGLVGALIKSRHEFTWRFARDPFEAGRIATIVDHIPNREPERWYLYAKP